ncbi:PREDICTED: MADS-box protein AGL42-like [Lupinus angustifolius]|uniref:MADS-box protein AGL42-like n=1 Tax=Lupinus angustifolius TaxID=3871 RepID=UPI00092F8A86|nr:PREDICTED: MADS-box protein AGL42-like [Lupinus angustifolius]
MVRGKIQMKKIENENTRQVTFSKRKSGLVKKSYELSVLTDAQVALIIFSQKGRLYEFSSNSDIRQIVERYGNYTNRGTANMFREEFIQQRKFDSASLAEKIELLELSKRKMVGHGLSSYSIDELQGIEDQLQRSLESIRLRKAQLYKEHIEQLHTQERNLVKDNAELSALLLEKLSQKTRAQETAPHTPRNQSLGVETQLFIGLPHHPC